jgi:hypothetical protein
MRNSTIVPTGRAGCSRTLACAGPAPGMTRHATSRETVTRAT